MNRLILFLFVLVEFLPRLLQAQPSSGPYPTPVTASAIAAAGGVTNGPTTQIVTNGLTRPTIFLTVTGSDANNGTNITTPIASLMQAIMIASNFSKGGVYSTIQAGPGVFDIQTNFARIPKNVTLVGAGTTSTIFLSTVFANTNDPNSSITQNGPHMVPADNDAFLNFSLRCVPSMAAISNIWQTATAGPGCAFWSGFGASNNFDAFTNVYLSRVNIEEGEFDSFFIGCYTASDATNATFTCYAENCNFGTPTYPARCDTIAVSGNASSILVFRNCTAYMDMGGSGSSLTNNDGGGVNNYNTFLRNNGLGLVVLENYRSWMSNSTPDLDIIDTFPTVFAGTFGGQTVLRNASFNYMNNCGTAQSGWPLLNILPSTIYGALDMYVYKQSPVFGISVTNYSYTYYFPPVSINYLKANGQYP